MQRVNARFYTAEADASRVREELVLVKSEMSRLLRVVSDGEADTSRVRGELVLKESEMSRLREELLSKESVGNATPSSRDSEALVTTQVHLLSQRVRNLESQLSESCARLEATTQDLIRDPRSEPRTLTLTLTLTLNPYPYPNPCPHPNAGLIRESS